LSDRQIQDYLSAYHEIHANVTAAHRTASELSRSDDWHTVHFEIDLLKSIEVNLDYILALISNHATSSATLTPPASIWSQIEPLVLASSSLRGKKELLEQFLRQAEPDHLRTPSDSLEHFHSFASKQLAEEAMHIVSKPLHGLPLKREPTLAYLKKSCEAGVASAIGEDLPACLPPMRRNDPRASLLRNDLLLIASNFVNKFAGVPWTFNT